MTKEAEWIFPFHRKGVIRNLVEPFGGAKPHL